MVSVVGKVIKILKEEGSYKTWMHEAFESTVVVNEKHTNENIAYAGCVCNDKL